MENTMQSTIPYELRTNIIMILCKEKTLLEKIEIINNKHPLLTKVIEAENDLNLFLNMSNDAKESLLNRGKFNYEIAKYMYETYFSDSYYQKRHSVQISDMRIAYLRNLSYEDIAKENI